VPAADLFVSGPGNPGLLVNPPVVLDRRGTEPGHHPCHDCPTPLIVAGVGGRQRRQTVIDHVLLYHARNSSRWRAQRKAHHLTTTRRGGPPFSGARGFVTCIPHAEAQELILEAVQGTRAPARRALTPG